MRTVNILFIYFEHYNIEMLLKYYLNNSFDKFDKFLIIFLILY